MNHEFISNNNEDKCIECGYPESKHGNSAVCDCCDKTGNLEIFMLGNSQALLTRECMEREKVVMEREIQISNEINSKGIQRFGVPPDSEDRLLQYNAIVHPYEKLIAESRKIDEQLHLSSDIFTAKTTSIEEIRKTIWADDSIPNEKKFFEFVAFCKQRINHFQSIIFDLDKQKIEAYSEQKAWHIAMNDYANKLRKEEREQLRIQDITYDVKMPKPVTPQAIKLHTKKATKEEMRNAVNALNKELNKTDKDGIPEFLVQTIMISKNWDLTQTINHLRDKFNEGLTGGIPVTVTKPLPVLSGGIAEVEPK